MTVTVSALSTFPIKSLGAFSTDAFALDHFGPVGDRRWMLVDSAGRFLSQREHASLSRVAVSLDGAQLRVEAPDAGVFQVPAGGPEGGESRSVRIWGDVVEAVDGGEQAARWFSGFLGLACRLVYLPESAERRVDPAFSSETATLSFADAFPLLLINEASLEAFNSELSQPIDGGRFRANIVVSGAAAWAEDEWRQLRIGDLEFDVAKACSRCVVPSIDPVSAEMQPEVTRTLFRMRRREDNHFYFGINLVHRGEGRVALGDQVEILS